jgi:hypothetical protein
LAAFGHLLGQVRLPAGQLVVCCCVAIRGGDESSAWLDSYVPVGALDNAGLAYWDGRLRRGLVLLQARLLAHPYWAYRPGSLTAGWVLLREQLREDAAPLAGRRAG